MPLLLKHLFTIAARCKSLFNLKKLFFKTILLSSYLLFCTNASHASLLDKAVAEESQFEADDLYQALAAEVLNQLGNQNLAVDYYYTLSANNNDPAIAKRVTELATVTGQIAKALNGAKRWVALEPESLEANQYLALLLIRNSHFTSGAKQLDSIRALIEKTSDSTKRTKIDDKQLGFQSSESLTFIGAMLAAESHHKKAFTTFSIYLKKIALKNKRNKIFHKQQQLISAQLAMKAKNYEAVIERLKGLGGLDNENHVDAKVMYAKALHKLGKNVQAIKQLKSIQNNHETKDSHRLELVRLLVLDKQKSTAIPLLKDLVIKHPKNYELLKSLIALQVDQKQFDNISSNIKLLRANSNYINEADYFTGEFAEKLGEPKKALLSYVMVKDGSYLKNAHKKIISLTKKVEGADALKVLFDKRQKNATTIKDQAYWIKLEADELFESNKYSSALYLYTKAVALAPNQSRYRFKRGLVNERLGNLQNAELDFNYVLAIRENDFEVLNALGYMLSVHTKRYTEAKSYIDKAYKLKPNDPLVLDSLGFVLYKTGELNKAEKYLRKSYNLRKKPEVASHLITVLSELNQIKEAKSIYREMHKKYPDSPSLKNVSDRVK